LPEDYSRERYTNETRRLYNALDKHLEDAKSEFVVGDKCTVADIALWTWARILAFAGLDIAEFPNVQAWHNRVSQRPAVQTGSNIPLNVDLDALEKDKAAFGKYLKGNSAWIRKGMEVDHKN
jgi:glutathione S-transferase